MGGSVPPVEISTGGFVFGIKSVTTVEENTPSRFVNRHPPSNGSGGTDGKVFEGTTGGVRT